MSNTHFKNKIFQIEKNDAKTIAHFIKFATFDRYQNMNNNTHNQIEKIILLNLNL